MKTTIDHLIYTAPDLTQGMDHIESLLGMRPVIGGQHHQWGTHNALLSLGELTYLEVVAPDPSLPTPDSGRWLADHYEPSRLTTWALGSTDIRSLHDKATSAGIALGAIESGQRVRPDGNLLQWQLTNPSAMPHGGAVPFIIDWGDTPHPASSLPSGGELVSMTIYHPDAEQVKTSLTTLDIASAQVERATEMKIAAQILTPQGIVELT